MAIWILASLRWQKSEVTAERPAGTDGRSARWLARDFSRTLGHRARCACGSRRREPLNFTPPPRGEVFDPLSQRRLGIEQEVEARTIRPQTDSFDRAKADGREPSGEMFEFRGSPTLEASLVVVDEQRPTRSAERSEFVKRCALRAERSCLKSVVGVEEDEIRHFHCRRHLLRPQLPIHRRARAERPVKERSGRQEALGLERRDRARYRPYPYLVEERLEPVEGHRIEIPETTRSLKVTDVPAVVVCLRCAVSPIPADAKATTGCEGAQEREFAEVSDVAGVAVLHGHRSSTAGTNRHVGLSVDLAGWPRAWVRRITLSRCWLIPRWRVTSGRLADDQAARIESHVANADRNTLAGWGSDLLADRR
jgi:hypothetical protein